MLSASYIILLGVSIVPSMHKNDRQLLFHRIKEGSATAFKETYEEYHVKVYFFVRRYIRDARDIEDIVQNIFIHLWNYRERIDPKTPLQAILFKTAKQEIALWYRNNKPVHLSGEEHAHGNIEVLADDQKEGLWQREKMAEILRLIDQLPERRKTIFRLHKLEEKSHREIALALNMTPSAVANQISKTLKFLKLHLNNYFW